MIFAWKIVHMTFSVHGGAVKDPLYLKLRKQIDNFNLKVFEKSEIPLLCSFWNWSGNFSTLFFSILLFLPMPHFNDFIYSDWI